MQGRGSRLRNKDKATGSILSPSRYRALSDALRASKQPASDREAREATPLPVVEERQIALYRDRVLRRVQKRFESTAAAERWFVEGKLPGYSETPQELVRAGLGADVIEAINAIEAGVYA